MYAVVKFVDDNEVEIVPTIWLDGTRCCLWPINMTTSKILKAVKNCQPGGKDWPSYPIEIKYETDNYEKAHKKVKEALYQSDIQTAESMDEDSQPPPKAKRISKPNSRYMYIATDSDTESEEDGVPVLVPAKKARRNGDGYQLPPVSRLPTPPVPQSLLQATPKTPVPSTSMESPISRELHQSADEDMPVIRLPRTPVSAVRIGRSSVQQVAHSGHTPTSTVSSVSVLRAVETLREEVNELKQMVHQVLVCIQRGGSCTVDELNLPEDVVLPVASHEAMEEMERYLQDPLHEKRLVDYLSVIGGGSLSETVRSAMEAIIAHNLALEFNYTKNGPRKGSFENLRLKVVVFKAIRRSPHMKLGTEKQIKTIIQDWFRFAADRKGGKKKRDHKRSQQTES